MFILIIIFHAGEPGSVVTAMGKHNVKEAEGTLAYMSIVQGFEHQMHAWQSSLTQHASALECCLDGSLHTERKADFTAGISGRLSTSITTACCKVICPHCDGCLLPRHAHVTTGTTSFLQQHLMTHGSQCISWRAL